MRHISEVDTVLPLTPQIYRLLHRRIVTNILPPGTLVSQPEIARECQVSRQPVREAFIKLEEQGLVVVLPQRGTLVSKISYAAVLDAQFLREAIEADIVRIVAAQRDPALVASLRSHIKEQRACGQQSARRFIQLDESFHLLLANGAGKPGAWRLIEGLKSQLDRVRFLSLEQLPMTRLIEQHNIIVKQIAAGNVQGAEDAIRTHLRQVLTDLPAILSANPDYFDQPANDTFKPLNASYEINQ